MLNQTEDLNLLRRFVRTVRGKLIRRKPSADRHLHGKIGTVIHEHKKRLYKRLKAGANLALACDNFLIDLTRDLREIVKKESEASDNEN